MKLTILFLSFAILTSCGRTLGSGDETNFQVIKFDLLSSVIDFPTLSKFILRPKCLRCHQGEASTEEGVSQWIEGAEVESTSFFKEVDSGRMPRRGAHLTQEEMSLVIRYIETRVTPPIEDPPPTLPKSDAFPIPKRWIYNSLELEDIKKNILNPKCLECHDDILEDDLDNQKIMEWMGQGDIANSLLYQYIKDDEMPLDGEPLSKTEKQKIKNFIKSMLYD